jgi:hypothetical protein
MTRRAQAFVLVPIPVVKGWRLTAQFHTDCHPFGELDQTGNRLYCSAA